MEGNLAVFNKNIYALTFCSRNLLLGIYSENTPATIQSDIYTSLFIAALFVIAKYWKQLKCSNIDVLNKLYPHNGVLCSGKRQ